MLSEFFTFHLTIADDALTLCRNLGQQTSSGCMQYVRRMKIPVLSTFVDSTLIGRGVGETGEGRIAEGFLTN